MRRTNTSSLAGGFGLRLFFFQSAARMASICCDALDFSDLGAAWSKPDAAKMAAKVREMTSLFMAIRPTWLPPYFYHQRNFCAALGGQVFLQDGHLSISS